MTRVINAVDLNGGWFEFTIDNGRFGTVTPQPARIARPLVPSTVKSIKDWQPTTTRGAAATGREQEVYDADGACVVPGAVDIHVHSRDPGLTHKEDWLTLARGAFRGGVVAVCDMPNTLPPTLDGPTVRAKAALAEAAGLRAGVMLGVGAGNVGHLKALIANRGLPLAGLKVFYGKTTGEMMFDDLEALARALPDPESMPVPVVFHSEDQCLVDHNTRLCADRLGRTGAGDFAVHSEVRSSEAAHRSTRAILDWAAARWRGPVHIAHVSTPLEVELVAAARAAGGRVSCEVAPHHLMLSTDDYARLGARAKMNPPLRSPAEVVELRRLVGQGLVDAFATDHAPHLLSEKAAPVGKAPSGVPGVELYYPLLFRCAELCGLSRARALAMATARPAAICGFGDLGRIEAGAAADFVWLEFTPQTVRDADVVSKCGWTPYDGERLPCRVRGTWTGGCRVYDGG